MLKFEKLLVGITFFHYNNNERYEILRKISENLDELCKNIKIIIITVPIDDTIKAKIINCFKDNFDIQITEKNINSDPYLLTWEHLKLFKQHFENDFSISHFLYLEDDHIMTKINMEYWLKSREELKPAGLIPSFLRYEKKNDDENLYLTDLVEPLEINQLCKVIISSEYGFFNVPSQQLAYQGIYLLDRELAKEHFYSNSFNPGLHGGIWGIREGATQGVTFLNVPKGFITRNVVKFNIEKKIIDQAVLIHHAPNNYANDLSSRHGKLSYSELLI